MTVFLGTETDVVRMVLLGRFRAAEFGPHGEEGFVADGAVDLGGGGGECHLPG